MEANVYKSLMVQYKSAVKQEGRFQHTLVDPFVVISLEK